MDFIDSFFHGKGPTIDFHKRWAVSRKIGVGLVVSVNAVVFEAIKLRFFSFHFLLVLKPIMVIRCFTIEFHHFSLPTGTFKKLVSAYGNEVGANGTAQVKIGIPDPLNKHNDGILI